MQADPSDWLVALGDALREARQDAGMSQERLGLDAGIHRNYVGGVERGQRNPSVECIVTLANQLDVAPPDLFVKAGELLSRSRPASASASRK